MLACLILQYQCQQLEQLQMYRISLQADILASDPVHNNALHRLPRARSMLIFQNQKKKSNPSHAQVEVLPFDVISLTIPHY